MTKEIDNKSRVKKSLKSKKILIADDDKGILKIMSLMLRLQGYEVEATMFGISLLEMSEDELPDLILLDLWMAGINGCEICQELKSDAIRKNIPVILVSAGQGLPEIAEKCAADDFLEKPFEQTELLEKVAQYLN